MSDHSSIKGEDTGKQNRSRGRSALENPITEQERISRNVIENTRGGFPIEC